MKKKRKLYCSCGNEAEIYRKGKKHKIIVCNQCGIIASNPLPFAALAASLAPMAIEAVSSKIAPKPKSISNDVKTQRFSYDNLDKPNKNERYVNLALKGC